jgi:hypothetical protein
MSEINFGGLAQNMLAALKGPLQAHWEEAQPYAEKETQAFTDNIKLIASLKLQGKIDEEQARMYMEIQRSSMRVVLLTIKGLGILAVENAINAALDVIRGTVNTALGWRIL